MPASFIKKLNKHKYKIWRKNMQREMIGETIRKFRAERKLSREMLAEQTGISVSHLEKIENNLRNPSMKSVKIMCGLYEFWKSRNHA